MSVVRTNILAAVIWLSLTAVCIWRYFTMDETGISTCFVPILMVAISAMIILPPALKLLVARLNAQRDHQIRSLFRNLREFYSGDHLYAAATIDRFPASERPFYERITEELRSNGFDLIADLEDQTNTHIYPDCAVCTRYMGLHEGTAIASLSSLNSTQLRLPAAMQMQDVLRSLEIQTQFIDGVVLTTLHPPVFHDVVGPSQYLVEWVPWESGTKSLVFRHAERVAEYLRAHTESQVIPVRNVEELVSALHAAQRIMNAYKKAQGYASDDFVKRLGTKFFPNQDLKYFLEAFERVRSEQI